MNLNAERSDILVVTPGGVLTGELGPQDDRSLPGDKSLSHRAALFAALAQGSSRIENFLVSGVTQAMLGALTALDVPWELQDRSLRVEGVGLTGLEARQEEVYIDCGNSATTLRLLAGALAVWNLPAILDGSPGLRRRPMRRIVEPLQRMGVHIRGLDGCAPLTQQPTRLPLRSLEHSLSVASAQVKSCLLLAGLAADGPTTLTEPGPSRDHTERMLGSMGVEISSQRIEDSYNGPNAIRDAQYVTRLAPPQSGALVPLDMTLPGDISAAAFLIVAALITPGSRITLRGVGLNPTRTGLLDALSAMGADLLVTNRNQQGGEPVGDLSVAHSQLRGTTVNGELVVRMIDEFPAFAVAAAYAEGSTEVSEAIELRHKESDRISAMCRELSGLGVDVTEKPDGFTIQGGRTPQGGQVDPHGDHRLAMSLAVAGLAARSPVTVRNAAIIGESFPEFVQLLQSLGADLEERNV